jgi:hypothetical protein
MRVEVDTARIGGETMIDTFNEMMKLFLHE